MNNDAIPVPRNAAVVVLVTAAVGSLMPVTITFLVGGGFVPALITFPIIAVPLAALALVIGRSPARFGRRKTVRAQKADQEA